MQAIYYTYNSRILAYMQKFDFRWQEIRHKILI